MSELGPRHGEILLTAARAAISSRLGLSSTGVSRSDREDPLLLRLGASFVTLEIDGELRGCIGALEPRLPLIEDVEANACSAAFEDHRFAPLAAQELEALAIEISVLSPLEAIDAADLESLLRSLRPGVDGLLLQSGVHRATFLPQVWATLREPERFVAALAKKAGLSPDVWPPQIEFWRYSVQSWTRG